MIKNMTLNGINKQLRNISYWDKMLSLKPLKVITKDLYFHISHLLTIKPYLHLALSIGIILIIRILFIQTVYAEELFSMEGRMSKSEQVFLPAKSYQDYNDCEIFKITETKYVTSRGDIIYTTKTGFIINPKKNPFEDMTGNETCEPEPQLEPRLESKLEKNNQAIINYPDSLDYNNIIKEYGQLLTNAKSKKEFMQTSLDFVKNVMPNIWSTTADDLKDPNSPIQRHIVQFAQKIPTHITQNEFFIYNIYSSTVMTYNVLHMANNLEYNELLEKVYTDILERNYGERPTARFLSTFDKREMLQKTENFKRPQIQ